MPVRQELSAFRIVDPSGAKVGEIQSQDARGAAVVFYCNPMATPDLDFSGFSARVTI